MLILAVDTSSDAGSLALLRDRSIVSQQASSPNEPFSSSLLRQATTLLETAQISFEQIDLLAVAAGPGSFTGLRVGLTTIKGWAEVWGIRIAAVSGLEAMAAQVIHLAAPKSLIASVMDARRGQVFGGIFRQQANGSGALEPVSEEILANADEFISMLQGHSGGAPLLIACLDPELIRSSVEGNCRSGCRIETVSNLLAPFIGQLAYAKALRGEVVDALHLDANYIRRSDAEMKWRVG